MTVSVRLQRTGKPNRPYYRVVAIEKRKKRDGKPLELLGHFDPLLKENKMTVKKERVDYWVKQGAEVSRTVSSMLKKIV
jgi:small subunit ribosomal protein S16